MWPEDMPQPGTRQWAQWFDRQDPDMQDQILFDFGLSGANEPVQGSGIGAMQPEISSQGFGMISQMAPPPVINSKGKIQPSGTEQVQKQLNLFQDQNSLMTDNVLAALAGQFAPTAFTPEYLPQGNPVQQTGLRQLQSLSNTGGWEGFMAAQMLPREYGGGGMSSSQAKGALLKAIMTPDTADQAALDLREELRGSLTPRYETQGQSKDPRDTPVNKDLSTAQGVANAFDLSDVDMVSRQWQSDLAKDPLIGYTDPTTGLSYEGGPKEIKTPTMEWFDKYGLPYANKQYSDPDQIQMMQDAAAPVAPGQLEAEDLRGQQALAANAKARGELGEASGQFDILERAYNEATKAGLLNPQQNIAAPGPQRPAAQATPSSAPRSLYDVPPPPWLGGGATSPAATAAPAAPQTPREPRFLMDLTAGGQLAGLAGDQTTPSGQLDKDPRYGGIRAGTNFDFSSPGATIPGEIDEALRAFLPGSTSRTPARRVMTAADLGTARQRLDMAKRSAAATVPGIQAATRSSDADMARQLAKARMIGLSLTGRTPLSDTLAGRMMAARSAGIYG